MMRRNCIAWLIAAAPTFFGVASLAQTVFTTDTVINNGTYEGQDIVVRGCTVAIVGSHTFRSIVVERNASNQPGIINHAPSGFLSLLVTTDVTVQGASGALVASRIDVSGRGMLGGTGTAPGIVVQNGPGGGASHAGRGGLGAAVASSGVANYGSVQNPSTPGSGGANGCASTAPLGGAGGGTVNLRVTGTLTLDGIIAANGGFGLPGATTTCATTAGGGGSGGSVWLTVGTLAGSGVISANGGDGGRVGESNAGGGGGGGRVAIQTTVSPSTFTGVVTAFGGNGNTPGGAGTVYRQHRSDPWVLRMENDRTGGVSEWSPVSGAGTATIGPNAIITGPRNQPGASVTINVSTDLTIEQGGAINLDGLGYGPGSGPGSGLPSNGSAGATGGGYGGAGGRGSGTSLGGPCSGSFSDLTGPGSGGGRPCGNQETGSNGSGGGSLRLNVTGTLRNDGVISANGITGRVATQPGCVSVGGGGGSGGGIYITAATLLGSGVISVNGGAGGNLAGGTLAGGGGGGGRIVMVHSIANSFAGSLSAFGGNGFERGGAGSIFARTLSGSAPANLLYSNGGAAGALTEISNSLSVGGNLTVRGGARLGIRSRSPFTVQPTGNLTIESDGVITVDSSGGMPGVGLGSGGNDPVPGGLAGGGGYGGAGGSAPGHGLGAPPFGLPYMPLAPGGGGGNGCSAPGGIGGGAVRVNVGGTLRVDGRLSADGGAGAAGAGTCAGSGGGGGAGGSVWISAHTVAGLGVISASGGNAGVPQAGGGGGGRIAIYSCDRQIPLSQVVAAGGSGAGSGGSGTIFLGSSSVVFNRNLASRNFSAGSPMTISVAASGNGPLSYQWLYNSTALNDGDRQGRVSGAHTDALTIDAAQTSDSGGYAVLVTDNCGSLLSSSVTFSVVCRADLDDGTGTGVPDGGVTIDDLTYFLVKYEAGDVAADLDDGSGTGNATDGGVTIEDLLYMLVRYEIGC